MKTLTLPEWIEFTNRVHARANKLVASRREQAFALARSVGIHQCMCSLHNAAMDDKMIGWCKDNPHRLAVAKKANWMLTTWVWEPSEKARAITKSAWNRIPDVCHY